MWLFYFAYNILHVVCGVIQSTAYSAVLRTLIENEMSLKSIKWLFVAKIAACV